MLSKEQKRKAWKDLLMLNALPPYDVGSNICAHDGYFASGLVSRYGMSVSELEKQLGFLKKVAKYLEAKELAATLLKNPFDTT